MYNKCFPAFICSIVSLSLGTRPAQLTPRLSAPSIRHQEADFGPERSLFRDHEPRGTFNKFTTSHIDSEKENNREKRICTGLKRTQLYLV